MDVYLMDMKESMGTDTNNEGISLNLFFVGCSMEPKCAGCHNPELWKHKSVEPVSSESVCNYIRNIANMGMITHIVFVGGEPLDQPEALLELATKAQEVGLTTWLYTGHAYIDVSTKIQHKMNVVVAGRYEEEFKTGGFPGSENQVVVRKN